MSAVEEAVVESVQKEIKEVVTPKEEEKQDDVSAYLDSEEAERLAARMRVASQESTFRQIYSCLMTTESNAFFQVGRERNYKTSEGKECPYFRHVYALQPPDSKQEKGYVVEMYIGDEDKKDHYMVDWSIDLK